MATTDYQERESFAVSKIKSAIPESLKKNMVKDSSGWFAELYETGILKDHYCVCSADTAGTKTIIAEAMEKYDTIGIDVVAMNVNDLATLGAVSPFLFLNCMSVQHEIEEKGITGQLMKGISKGLELSDTSDIINKSISVNI